MAQALEDAFYWTELIAACSELLVCVHCPHSDGSQPWSVHAGVQLQKIVVTQIWVVRELASMCLASEPGNGGHCFLFH